jgi:Zn-dependent protease with chaperone function
MSLSSPQGYLTPRLQKREHAHRRWLLLGLAAGILLSLSPVVGHHLSRKGGTYLAGQDHVFGLCLVALHELLAPVHTMFHVILYAGVAYALYDRARALVGLNRTLQQLSGRDVAQGDGFFDAARDAGVPLDAIRIVPDLPVPAFTAGMFAPKIFVTEDLGQILSHDQLVAVLAHENAHRRRFDPLRLSALRFLGRTLFVLPALRRLSEDIADEAEIAADDEAAANEHVTSLVLASAIIELASRSRKPMPIGAVGFEHVDLLERRVRRLAGEDSVAGTHVTRGSLLGATTVLAAIWVSGVIMAHPMPTDLIANANAHPSGAESQTLLHCDHPGATAFSHLFCLFDRAQSAARATELTVSGAAASCPHAHLQRS